MPALRIHTKHIKRFSVQSYRKIQRPALQELRQTLSRQGKMRLASAVKRGGSLLRRSNSGYGGRESKRAPDAKARKGSRNCKADDLQEMVTALRSQLNHVRDQTAFLSLKRSEMRPGDHVSLYGFMDAQEQLKIEKSLLAGHAPILQDMMTEMKVKPDMETRRLLNEIRNNAA